MCEERVPRRRPGSAAAADPMSSIVFVVSLRLSSVPHLSYIYASRHLHVPIQRGKLSDNQFHFTNFVLHFFLEFFFFCKIDGTFLFCTVEKWDLPSRARIPIPPSYDMKSFKRGVKHLVGKQGGGG